MRDQYSVNIGEWVTVGHNVTLHGCTIEDTCLIGMGSVILNNVRIGRGSVIALVSVHLHGRMARVDGGCSGKARWTVPLPRLRERRSS